MKAFIRLFSSLIILIPFFSFANVYVHGYVKYPNGTPATGILVIINSDTAIAQSTCQQSHYRNTNNAGFYSDTLICTGTISQVKTRISNPCTGTLIIHDQVPNANLSVESNFTICDSASNTCFSSFTWRDTLNQVFFSSISWGATPLDTVISRLWTFGDGTSLSGNVTDPVHTYAIASIYTVCLKTKTVSGCEKTTCNAVTLTIPSCNAVFNWSRNPTILYRVLFNSTASSAISGDSIVSRKWRFGDGDTLIGNTISPEHTYPGYGTYTACLTIKTRLGCEKTFCYIILVAPPTSCHAYFSTIYFGATATGYSVKFNSTGSIASYGDSIIQRSWTFGDNTSGTGTDPTHTYAQPGTYIACLIITSVAGCHDSVCQTVIIPYLHCEAVFYADSTTTPVGGNTALHYFRFNSITSHGTMVSDSIISRKWKFGDGDSLTGNVVAPVHGYAQPGTYTMCLYIVTTSGCKDTLCKTVIVRSNAAINCQPHFTTTANGLLVTFNTSTSIVATGDSIISRFWTLGDGATNTVAVLTHQYSQAGVYNACLTIHTRLGCTATICKLIAVVPVTGNCVPYFTKEQTAATARTIRFNSSAAYSQIPNDSIISRKWEFGDGQILTGNVVNPLHTYLHGGTYTACLTIYTAHCDKRWCQTVQVFPLDSTNTADSVSIVNLYPVPVNSPLYAVLYSSRSNINAQLAIYDVYGMLKWTQSTILPYGNSTQTIPTAQLAAGPYVFKVTTIYGVKSRTFYKIN